MFKNFHWETFKADYLLPILFVLVVGGTLLIGVCTTNAAEPASVKVQELVVVICKDGDCYDMENYIAPESVVIPAIRKHGHPGWMQAIEYDPKNPAPEEAESWD